MTFVKESSERRATSDEKESHSSLIAHRSALLHVSVVMPSFNHAKYIRDAIDSVLSQDYPDIDLLVMDGGSSDDTVEILKSYGDKIRWVSQKDKGQCDAINRGLGQLTGDIICWLNSDDLFTPGAIRAVAETFTARPEIDFVYGKGWTIAEDGKLKGDSGVLPLDVWKLIHQRNFIQQPSCFFRRSLFEKVGPVDEKLYYVMDWELWIRFAAHRGMYIDQYLSSNREYQVNKTQSGQFKRWREIRKIVRRYTHKKFPPVVRLYFLEATIQAARHRRWWGWLELPLSRVFFKGMFREMSGRYLDGGVEKHFKVSIGNPDAKRVMSMQFSPLSRHDPSLRDDREVTIHWRSHLGERGEITVIENGKPQRFSLPLSPTGPTGFIHFDFKIDRPPVELTAGQGLPQRQIAAFVDSFEATD